MKSPDDPQEIMDELREREGELVTVTMYTRDDQPDFDFTYRVWMVCGRRAALEPTEHTPDAASENLELRVPRSDDPTVEMFLGGTYIGVCASVRGSMYA